MMEERTVILSLEELSPILNSLLEQGQTVTLQVTGTSMMPLWMHRRDQVVLEHCQEGSLKNGDIVLLSARKWSVCLTSDYKTL